MSLHRTTAALLCVLALTACAVHRVEFQPAPELPPLHVNRIPASVAFTFTDAARSHRHVARYIEGWEQTILTGPGSLVLFRTLIPQLFQRAEEVSTIEATPAESFDAFLVVDQASFAAYYGQSGGRPEKGVQVGYHLRLIGPTGTLVHAWQARGESRISGEIVWPVFDEEVAGEAMRRAGADFTASFFRDPVLRDWVTARRQ